MGLLRECKVVSLSNDQVFNGHAWTCDDGTFEAFWNERGNRITQFFNSNGEPLGFFNKYKIAFK